MDETHPDNAAEARRHREERMRYEVLDMLARLASHDPDRPVNCGPLAEDIGVWREELFRVIDFLDHAGLVRYCGAGPVVCVTERGVSLLESGAGRTRRIADGV